MAKHYYIGSKDNKIYKRGDDKYGARLLIQRHKVLDLLRRIHDHWMGGHIGVTRTFLTISKEYYWPNYYDDVKLYVLSCPVCQRFKNNATKVVPLQSIPVPEDGPFSEVMMDFCSLPTSDSTIGFNYVLVIIDMFSGRVECYPCLSEQEDITVLGLYEWMCRFGLPKKVYCDGGSHFITKIVDIMIRRYGIELALGPSHHSQRQGKVERVIQTLKGLLKKLCDQYQGSWVNWLSAACYVIRTNVYFGHGFSPFFLVHGRHPRGLDGTIGENYLKDWDKIKGQTNQLNKDHEMDVNTLVAESQENEDLELEVLASRLEELLLLLEEILPAAVERQLLIKKKQTENYNREKKAEFRTYRIGDSVMIRNYSKGDLSKNNLGAIWIGPYKIDQKLPNNVYILADGNLRIPGPIHANNMKLYLLRPKDNSIYRKWTIDGLPQRILSPEDNLQEKEDSTSPVIRKRRRHPVSKLPN